MWDRIVVGPELRERLAELGRRPVLLVDDLADSRWTMTVAGRELRRAGAAVGAALRAGPHRLSRVSVQRRCPQGFAHMCETGGSVPP